MDPVRSSLLRSRVAELVPSRLDLALPVAEELAACDPSCLPVLEDIHGRLEAATARHQALEIAFAGRAIPPLLVARQAMNGTDDRRSDDLPLIALADAELQRRGMRQHALRAQLAAMPRHDLDRALDVAEQLTELEPDGEDALQASQLRALRQRLDHLHRQIISALAHPLQHGQRALLHEISTAPWRLPDSTALIGRLAKSIQAARAQRRRRYLLLAALLAALLAGLAFGFGALRRNAAVQTDVRSP